MSKPFQYFIGVGAGTGNLFGVIRILKDILPKFAWKTSMRQTFSLQLFCGYWCIIFSTAMLPYVGFGMGQSKHLPPRNWDIEPTFFMGNLKSAA